LKHSFSERYLSISSFDNLLPVLNAFTGTG
jgi:hypothetical protein